MKCGERSADLDAFTFELGKTRKELKVRVVAGETVEVHCLFYRERKDQNKDAVTWALAGKLGTFKVPLDGTKTIALTQEPSVYVSKVECLTPD